ncbi:MAG: NYN domain-containing protein [Fibrobacter sp.]|uniref:NYN domain-containing protein n=1 Tax=Fibrobacter sp. TaxID=35828 RepID=UPI001B0DEA39|nr:NYN domain-containing protein [Fibrobacter sp.]MBO7059695.1 NYN domain-containing protein [Fibrobacter sp.]MBR3670717.1 NYN domain-containing protein [Fibrobacter sp.]
MEDFRIGFFIDGFTLKRVNEYYRFYHPYKSRLNFKGLKSWVKAEAVQVFHPKGRVSMEAHYYHPYKDPKTRGWHTTGILRFEQQIAEAGMQVHYSENHLDNQYNPNMALLDDAVVFSCYHKLDAIVLLSTQGQYATLPERVARFKVPVLLLGWNFSYLKNDALVTWRTDMELKDRSSYYVAMDKVVENLNEGDPLRFGIFQRQKRLVKSYFYDGGADKVTVGRAS